jgi:hypothetical protein
MPDWLSNILSVALVASLYCNFAQWLLRADQKQCREMEEIEKADLDGGK